jgi:hypothetical protein
MLQSPDRSVAFLDIEPGNASMSRLPHVACTAVGLFVIAAVCWLSTPRLNAQSSEFEATRFAPTDTWAAMSLNMQKILEKVDFEDPLIARLTDLGSGNLWDRHLERVMVLFSSKSDGESLLTRPVARLLKYRQPLNPQQFFETHHLAGMVDFPQQVYKGQPMYEAKFKENFGARGLDQGWFFPEENVVIEGSPDILRQMIDSESTLSDGMELVNRLDAEAEMHFLLQGSDRIDAERISGMGAGMLMGRLIANARRVEILGRYDATTPLQLTIEMDTDEHMDELMEMIDAARAAAPLALDGLERQITKMSDGLREELRESAGKSLKELVGLVRTSVKQVNIEREGTNLRMTLDHVDGLEKLPHLLLVAVAWLAVAVGP